MLNKSFVQQLRTCYYVFEAFQKGLRQEARLGHTPCVMTEGKDKNLLLRRVGQSILGDCSQWGSGSGKQMHTQQVRKWATAKTCQRVSLAITQTGYRDFHVGFQRPPTHIVMSVTAHAKYTNFLSSLFWVTFPDLLGNKLCIYSGCLLSLSNQILVKCTSLQCLLWEQIQGNLSSKETFRAG